MLKTTAFANAMTIIWLLAFVVCFGVAFLSPTLYKTIAGSWFHSINLQMSNQAPTLDATTIFAFVTFGITVWVISYGFALFYNKLAK